MKHNIKILLLLILFPVTAFTQNTVSGVVTDKSSNLPLSGINVFIMGTEKGTITDFDGNYTIEVNEGEIIVFSSIGYKTVEIPYNGETMLNIALQDDISVLSEVLLIGYGSAKRQDATGAVQRVTTETFNRGAIVSPDQLVSGKAAGVSVISNSGAPGEGAQIRIRGGSSLSANNDPLIVVDGIPLDQRGVQGVRNQLNSINPNEIESFDILKDAAATAIYGSRASNGVILITTKSGKKNQPFKVEYGFQFSLDKVGNTAEVFDAEGFRAYVAEQGRDLDRLGNADTDWQDLIYRDATGGIHDLSFSQGFERFGYRVNLNNSTKQGILRRDLFSRSAININFNADFFDRKLKLNLTSKGINDRNFYANTGAIGAAVHFDPTQPVRDSSNPYGGYFEYLTPGGNPEALTPRNPVALLELENNSASNYRTINNLNVSLDIPGVDGLKLIANAGMDYSELDGARYLDHNSAANTEMISFNTPFYEKYSGMNRNTNLDVVANYNNYAESINTNYDISLGHAYQEFFVESNREFIQNGELNILPVVRNRNALLSYFARVQFDISDRYLLSASYRRDGSSRFSENNRWSNFPAASVGWKIHNENFLNESNTISELKLRAGIGVTGNNEIGVNYGYLGIYTPGQDNASILLGNQLVNTLRPEAYDTNLKWEETVQYNAGIDIGLLENRLLFSVDAYSKTTKDLLARIPVPSGSNLSDFVTTNVGEISSRGLEFGLNTAIFKKENFNWNINTNLTFQEVQIKKLNLSGDANFFIEQGGISGGTGNNIQVWRPDLDPLTFFLLQQVYGQDGKPIEGAYADINGDNQITGDDRAAFKKATPDAFFGFTSTMNYKNFDFAFTLRGSVGNYVYNNVKSLTGFTNWSFEQEGGAYRNGSTDVLNTNFTTAQYFSSYYLERADFVRLDNVSVGYTLPMEKIQIRMSLTGTNLFVITDYSGIDPEISSGIDNNFYPRPRGYVLGLNFIF